MRRMSLVLALVAILGALASAPTPARAGPYSAFLCGYGLLPPCETQDYLTILSVIRGIPRF